jgi:hypothetical protein
VCLASCAPSFLLRVTRSAPPRSSPPSTPRKHVGRFVSGVDEAKNSESERNRFAERNEGFRIAGRKSLKSLSAANDDFAGSFVFNGLSAVSFRGFLACGSSDSKTLWFSAGERPFDELPCAKCPRRPPLSGCAAAQAHAVAIPEKLAGVRNFSKDLLNKCQEVTMTGFESAHSASSRARSGGLGIRPLSTGLSHGPSGASRSASRWTGRRMNCD